MEQNILLAELKKNYVEKNVKLVELLKTYELAELGRDMMNQHFKDINNRVLREHEFFANRNMPRRGIKMGERITDELNLYSLSEDGFDRFMEMANPIKVAEGLIDERGNLVTNWYNIYNKATWNLVNFIIDEIVPSYYRELCRSYLYSFSFQLNLINAFRK